MPPKPNRAALRPFVCPQCQSRTLKSPRPRFHSFGNPPRLPAASSTSPSRKILRLTNRSIIRLAGPDAALFLHNLVPAKILNTGSTNPVYTAFLSAHGRILNDVFIYPPSSGQVGEEWLIEVDETSAGELMKHLRKHKLRSKFSLEEVDAEKMGVYYGWPSETGLVEGNGVGSGRIGGQDPRPGMGTRWLDSPSPDSTSSLESAGVIHATLEEYTIHRILHGLAEGQSEIVSGSALPQESNIDFIGGIDFFKGCYLGQELTIRTHHTGVVRKRILPVQLYEKDRPISKDQVEPEYIPGSEIAVPPAGSNISKLNAKGRGRSSGKWLGGVGNIGLALCRLEMMTDIQLTADRTNYDPNEEYKVKWEVVGGDVEEGNETGEAREMMLKPFVPVWLREGAEQSLRRKEKKLRQRREEEEEEEAD